MIAISLAGMAPLHTFNPETAMADVFSHVGYDFCAYIIYFSAFIGLAAVLLSKTISMSMVMCAMGREGLLPSIFAHKDPLRKVPVRGALIGFAMVALPTFMLDVEELTKVVSLISLAVYSLTNTCGIALRFRS